MQGKTHSRENKIIPLNKLDYIHFLITSDYTNKHRSTLETHHKHHSHYVSSWTLLKLLDLLKTVISTFLLKNKARISTSFTSQWHSALRGALTVHIDAHEHLGMSRHTWTPLFGKQERKIIKKHNSAFIYVYFTKCYCSLKMYTSFWNLFSKILITHSLLPTALTLRQ